MSQGPRLIIGPRTLMVVALLIGFELLLRHFGFGQWTVTEQNERLGWRMLPAQNAWSRDLSVPETINAAGYRDREWGAPPPGKEAGVFRVALLGQSMTYGTSVPIEETWGRVLEDLLAAEVAPRRPMVMNFAVQGYVFEQMARVYEDDVRPWRPDLVVVPVHPHDITPMKPSQDDPDYDFRTWVLRTATYDLLNRHVINRWIPPPPPRERAAIQKAEALDAAITERPFAREHAPQWETLLRGLDGMREQVGADGGRLVLLTLPRWRKLFQPELIEADAKLEPFVRLHPESVLSVKPMSDFAAPMQPLVDELLEKGLAEKAILTSNLDEIVERGELGAVGGSLFLPDDLGHYTSRGHRVIGESVFRALKDAGWL